jgi:hypothetical protein
LIAVHAARANTIVIAVNGRGARGLSANESNVDAIDEQAENVDSAVKRILIGCKNICNLHRYCR